MNKLQQLLIIREEKLDSSERITEYHKLYDSVIKEMFFQKYPHLFGKHTFDFSTSPGWFKNISNLIEELISNEYDKEIKIVQVKEKFGGLRFYCRINEGSTLEYSKISEIISKYDDLCYKTCELCGEPGELIKGGWYKTRCEKHKNR